MCISCPEHSSAPQAHEGKLQGIIDTVSAVHDIPDLLKLLDNNGTICVVGVPSEPMHVPHMALLAGRKRVGGRYLLALSFDPALL